MQQQNNGSDDGGTLPRVFALGLSPSSSQQQVRREPVQRQPWPAAMFSFGASQGTAAGPGSSSQQTTFGNSSSSSRAAAAAAGDGLSPGSASLATMMPALGLGSSMGLAGASHSASQGHTSTHSGSFSAATAAVAAAAAGGGGGGGAGEPHTPVGSPVKPPRGPGSAAAAAAAGLASPPSWFSPKSRVRYSDRFIPTR